jgi:phosphatidylglycerophosphate synthase
MSTSTPGNKDGSRSTHWNLPNTLTWLRILMIPAIIRAVLPVLPYPWK